MWSSPNFNSGTLMAKATNWSKHEIVCTFSFKKNGCFISTRSNLATWMINTWIQFRVGVFSTSMPATYQIIILVLKVEKILKCSLDLVSSPLPSVKIQIRGGKVCLRCKGKTLLGIVNKLFVFISLLTSSSNVLPLHLSCP